MLIKFKILISIILLGGFSWGSLADDKSQQLTSKQLLDNLEAGGHIIYMRHAATERTQKDVGKDRLDSCEKQRNLSEFGREQAKNIGNIITDLNIPIGDVYTSPYCRCKDTAKLAFGKMNVENDLQFSISKLDKESKFLAQRLKEMMQGANTINGNVVFVGHTSNLKEAYGIWPKPEAVLVIFKKINDKITYQGMIKPDQLLSTLESL